MGLISGTIPSLINGVSQQPATLRLPTQGELQENGLSHIARGLEKRPCTEHVTEVTGITSTDSNDVFIHTIRRSEDEAYALIIKGGTTSTDPEIKLIDLTGFTTGTAGNEVYIKESDQGTSNITASTALTVGDFPEAHPYLTNFDASTNEFKPNKLSATTIADFTFLLNKTVEVAQNTSVMADTRNYESMVYFKVGDYGADYKLVLTEYNVGADGEMSTTSNTHTFQVKTPDNKTESRSGADTSETKSINNQAAVIVSNIARELYKGGTSHETKTVELVEFPTSAPKGVRVEEVGSILEYTGVEGVIDHVTYDSGAYTGGLETLSSTTSNNFTVTFVEGESIIYVKNNRYPFTIEATDGKGDTYMRALNGSDEVANFGHLPGTGAPTNFVAKISGDKTAGQDDYYVQWNGTVWKECNKPLYPGGEALVSGAPPYSHAQLKKDARTTLDNSTMPMHLYKAFGTVNGTSDQIYFIFKPVPWTARTVGDLNINPFPSFANYTDVPLYKINDIFFHRNRLGFVSDENVILSEAGEYFNFFHTTVLSVLDTAIIDVAVSNNQVAILKSAIPFQESLILFSDLQQFKLSSDSFLTPTSVTIDVATNFETSTEAKPVAAGKTIFFPFQRGAYSGIREYFINISSETNDANEVTAHVPEYIKGTVKKLAVSSNEEVLLVLSQDNRTELEVYKYYYNDEEKLQSAWSMWKFDAEIIDMEFVGSIAFFLFRRGSKIYLEKLNLSVDNATDVMLDKIGVRLDRRVKLTNAGTTSLPYSDENFDALSTTTITPNGTTSQHGTSIKITNLDKLDQDGVTGIKPREGQRFISSAMTGNLSLNTGTIYTVLKSTDVDTSDNTCTITMTPSISRDNPWTSSDVLTFESRTPVYVMETGQSFTNSALLSGYLADGSEFSVQKGITNPAIFAGIPYDFKYQFSEQFVKNNDNSINSGRLQMRNFEISYAKTGYFEVTVSRDPHDDRRRKVGRSLFTGSFVGSIILGIKELVTGVFRVPVYCSSKDAKITVSSKEWYPVALQSADWEAYQALRSQRI